jgi:hypothetical protein
VVSPTQKSPEYIVLGRTTQTSRNVFIQVSQNSRIKLRVRFLGDN